MKCFEIKKPVFAFSILILLTSVYILATLNSIYNRLETSGIASFKLNQIYCDLLILTLFLVIEFTLIRYLSKRRGLWITDVGLVDNQYLFGKVGVKWKSIAQVRLISSKKKHAFLIVLSEESLIYVSRLHRLFYKYKVRRSGGIRIPLDRMIESPVTISEQIIAFLNYKNTSV